MSVVPSESDYLGVTDELRYGTSGTDLVRNQFGPNTTIERIEIEVTAVGGYVRVGTDGPATRLAPGESVDLAFRGPYAAGDAAELWVEPPTGDVSGTDDRGSKSWRSEGRMSKSRMVVVRRELSWRRVGPVATVRADGVTDVYNPGGTYDNT